MQGRPAGRDWLRRALLIGGWVLLIALLWGTDLFVKFAERDTLGFGKDDHRLVVEQVTSGLGVLFMVPFVLRWLELFPLGRDRWPTVTVPTTLARIAGHAAGSAFFAFGHYSLMVAMRIAWYGATGVDYVWRDPFVRNLIVEYQKDIKIYLGIVVIVVAWRAFAARGTAEATGEIPSQVAADESARPDRLVVQTGSGTGIVRFDDIAFLEASRNYVVVHTADREYLVRDTMSALAERLDPQRFLRTHRSYIVNVDQIREIRTVDSAARIFLNDGREVPLSRSHKAALTEALGQ